MHLGNIVPLLPLSVIADIASYDPESGPVVRHTNIEEQAVNYKVLDGVLSILKGLGGPATTFCSSFLSIGMATITSTVTPAPTLVTVVTVTVSVAPPDKRDAAKPVPVPAALKGFVAAKLTLACKCLNIPSKTAKVTVTAATPVNIPIPSPRTKNLLGDKGTHGSPRGWSRSTDSRLSLQSQPQLRSVLLQGSIVIAIALDGAAAGGWSWRCSTDGVAVSTCIG
ncbi:hypothetical protein BKA65DRAFT_476946 [Rhexocercosporidium sp. MPI-PUGE-AT-0058]|nr:hypothetical protein BKA65DRAFT_476946 [Rhexocercosporidium sp. MPI-PUGE-AT-0058]